MLQVVIDECKMSVIDDLDHADAFGIVGDNGVAFFDQCAGQKLPGAGKWERRFMICRAWRLLARDAAPQNDGKGEQWNSVFHRIKCGRKVVILRETIKRIASFGAGVALVLSANVLAQPCT